MKKRNREKKNEKTGKSIKLTINAFIGRFIRSDLPPPAARLSTPGRTAPTPT